MIFWVLDYIKTIHNNEYVWVIRYDGLFCTNEAMDKWFHLEKGVYEKTMQKFNGIVWLLRFENYIFFYTKEDMLAGFEWLQSIIMSYQLADSDVW